MPYTRDDCLFCKIVAGSIPADEVHRDDHVVAFRDINPQAPTHILRIPTTHNETDADGVDRSGYRLLFNTGAGAGQTVFHAHLHLLGGRSLTWPPG